MPAYQEAAAKGAGLFNGCYNSADTAPPAAATGIREGGQGANPAAFHNSGVRVGEWWQADAWRTTTTGAGDRQQASAAMGSRAFGRRVPCQPDEMLARTDGRDPKALTSWGHDDTRWDRGRDPLPGAGPLPDSRAPRRAFVPPPSTAVMEASLHGEALTAAEPPEPYYFATGQATTPGRSLVASGTYTPARVPAAASTPWACDGDAPQLTEVLYDAKAGIARCGHGGGLAGAGSAKPRDHLHGAAANLKPEPAPAMTPSMTPSTAGGFGGMHASATGAPQEPAAGMAAAGEPTLASLPPVVAELCRLNTQLTARGVSWEAAFQPYDYARAGVVSMSDLLRIFRESGLSPPPSLLREVCQLCALRVRVTTSLWLAACSAPAHTHAQERGIAWLPRGCSASCGPCGTPRILRAPLRPMHA